VQAAKIDTLFEIDLHRSRGLDGALPLVAWIDILGENDHGFVPVFGHDFRPLE
jgi:hypothetical protein